LVFFGGTFDQCIKLLLTSQITSRRLDASQGFSTNNAFTVAMARKPKGKGGKGLKLMAGRCRQSTLRALVG
jgi:hypothetical protein